MFIGVFEGTEGREEVRVGATWHGDPGGHGVGRDQPWTRCAAQAAPCWARSPGLDAGQSRGGEG